MPLYGSAKRLMLYALGGLTVEAGDIPISQISLHSAWPETAGGFELIGSGYARIQPTWHYMTDTLGLLNPLLFSVPATTVRWIGFWDSAGTFMGALPLGGGARFPFTITDTPADVVTAPLHPFLDTENLVFWGGGGVEGTTYFVRDRTADTFKVALTSGGVAEDLPAGSGHIQRIRPVTFAAPAQFRLDAANIAVAS